MEALEPPTDLVTVYHFYRPTVFSEVVFHTTIAARGQSDATITSSNERLGD